jgi:hypothetical protein
MYGDVATFDFGDHRLKYNGFFLLFDAVHPFCPVVVQWSSVAWRSYQVTQQNLQFA